VDQLEVDQMDTVGCAIVEKVAHRGIPVRPRTAMLPAPQAVGAPQFPGPGFQHGVSQRPASQMHPQGLAGDSLLADSASAQGPGAKWSIQHAEEAQFAPAPGAVVGQRHVGPSLLEEEIGQWRYIPSERIATLKHHGSTAQAAVRDSVESDCLHDRPCGSVERLNGKVCVQCHRHGIVQSLPSLAWRSGPVLYCGPEPFAGR